MRYKYDPNQLRLKVGDFVLLKYKGTCHQIVEKRQSDDGVLYTLDDDGVESFAFWCMKDNYEKVTK